MANFGQCEQCGVQGLKWQGNPATTSLSLYEPDGGLHKCQPEDLARQNEKMKAQKEAVQKFFDGYL